MADGGLLDYRVVKAIGKGSFGKVRWVCLCGWTACPSLPIDELEALPLAWLMPSLVAVGWAVETNKA